MALSISLRADSASVREPYAKVTLLPPCLSSWRVNEAVGLGSIVVSASAQMAAPERPFDGTIDPVSRDPSADPARVNVTEEGSAGLRKILLHSVTLRAIAMCMWE